MKLNLKFLIIFSHKNKLFHNNLQKIFDYEIMLVIKFSKILLPFCLSRSLNIRFLCFENLGMEMNLKSMLDFVYIEDLNVADSIKYIQSRLGPSSIDEKNMQYWYNFYRGIKQQGRRCCCNGAHAVPRSICSPMLYCCEDPFELDCRKLIVGENVPNLMCEWNISYQAE